jgi:regulator of protease activity HflC (stomatin/prohibitin superfamily)
MEATINFLDQRRQETTQQMVGKLQDQIYAAGTKIEYLEIEQARQSTKIEGLLSEVQKQQQADYKRMMELFRADS